MEIYVLSINEVAKRLSHELNSYGTSELRYFKSLFTGNSSEKATIVGSINRKSFNVMMFDASQEYGISSVSAHFSSNINEMIISDGQAAFWNSDNRFTKIYRQDGDLFLVFDSFLSSEEDYIVQSVAKMWSIAINELPKLTISCERRGIF
jgi:hypothetical protein